MHICPVRSVVLTVAHQLAMCSAMFDYDCILEHVSFARYLRAAFVGCFDACAEAC